ncbi:MAG: CHC2 zinc finger domain-containing protein [Gemmataceae bacterium]|nr:CHC2 zinc finger domain-containing protein [Gemmataceae bacterium]
MAPPIDFSALKREVRIDQVLHLLGWQFHRIKGPQARGPCPIHHSHSPKSTPFAVHYGRQRWYCHICKDGGDVVDLWAKAHGLDLYAAAVDLCGALGVPVPYLPKDKAARVRSVLQVLQQRFRLPPRNGEGER